MSEPYVAHFTGGTWNGKVLGIYDEHPCFRDDDTGEEWNLTEQARLTASDGTLDVVCLRYQLVTTSEPDWVWPLGEDPPDVPTWTPGVL